MTSYNVVEDSKRQTKREQVSQSPLRQTYRAQSIFASAIKAAVAADRTLILQGKGTGFLGLRHKRC